MKWRSQAGGSVVTLLSDQLQRTTLGPNWAVGAFDTTQPTFFTPTGGLVETISGLILENSTGGGSQVTMSLQPMILFAGVLGQTQFAELAIVAKIGTISSDSGPAVAITGDPLTGGQNGYYVQINFVPSLSVHLANITNTAIIANTNSWVVGDVIRISCQFNPTSNHIIMSKNGVSIATADDAGALRPTTGLPGIFFKGASTVSGMKYNNFRGGLGLG